MKVNFTSTAGEVARMCQGTLVQGETSTPVLSISSDSRDLGPASLFVALRGDRFDGHDFIPQVTSSPGTSAIMVDRDVPGPDSSMPTIMCSNTLESLGALAAAYRSTFQVPFVGITGTNGKTTTRQLAHAMLSGRGKVHSSNKNYNNEIGVPFTLLAMEQDASCAVIEMGMNHAGEISRLSNMARPTIGVITSIGEGHLEHLGTVEAVARAKAEIMDGMEPGSPLVISGETDHVSLLMDLAGEKGIRTLITGNVPGSVLQPESYILTDHDITAVFSGHTFTVSLSGYHNLLNLTTALAAVMEAGVSLEDAAAGLENFREESGRGSVITHGSLTIIDDSYNANPLSVRAAVKGLADLYPRRRKAAVLGDMLELGDGAEQLHESTGRFAAQMGVDLLFAVGPMSRNTIDGARHQGMHNDRALWFESTEMLAQVIMDHVAPDDVVLVKGSRGMKMEKIVTILTGGSL